MNIAREFQDKMVTEIGKVDISIVTSTDIILNRIWDEDWYIADSKLVDNIPVASNTSGSLPAVIIAPNITLGQLLYLLETAYTTVEYLKQMVVFG